MKKKFYDSERNDLVVNSVAHCLATLLDSGAVKATKYLTEKLTVKVTWSGGKVDLRSRQAGVVVTFGAPNYAEREFIKRCRKAGEPFPVKKVQLKFAKPKVRVKKAA